MNGNEAANKLLAARWLHNTDKMVNAIGWRAWVHHPELRYPSIEVWCFNFRVSGCHFAGEKQSFKCWGETSGCRGERRDLLAEVSFQDQLTVADTNLEAHRTCGQTVWSSPTLELVDGAHQVVAAEGPMAVSLDR